MSHHLLSDPSAWFALLTLTALEIVLGIDNIIFISILVNKLPQESRKLARLFGLSLAMLTRIALLLSIVWIMKLTQPFATIFGFTLSGRDLILLFGGLFLIAKSTHEIHDSLDEGGELSTGPRSSSMCLTVLQIAVLDIVFSLDSVITAVGLAEHVIIMVLAIVIAVLVMMLAAKSIGEFVEENPTIKMLALSFLILVGVALIGESLHYSIPKGYIYFAMAYAFGVELLNMRLRKGLRPIRLDNKNQ